MRKLLFLAAVAILAWAGAVVPLPLASMSPVAAQPVADLVDMGDGADLDESLLFTAVELRQTTTLDAVRIGLDEDRSLVFVPAIVPGELDPEEFVELQERQFRESVRAAAAVGLRSAGEEVRVEGDGARIVRTIPGTPADGVLRAEDVITEVDGEEVELASELPSLLAGRDVGETVEVTVRRGDSTTTETIPIAGTGGTDDVGLGVLVVTEGLTIDLPVDGSAADDVQVGGPSAGLMIALAVHDAVTEEGVASDEGVAGTGTIRLDGSVGLVEGISEKVVGAAEAGAVVFLVPADAADEARDAAPAGMEVIPVRTIEDAIDALSERG